MPEPINIRFDVKAHGFVGARSTLAKGFTASIQAQAGASAKLKAPLFAVSGSGLVGAVGTLSVVLGRTAFGISATGSNDASGQAYLVAPAFRSVFGVYRDTAPLFILRASGGGVVTTVYKAYSVNVKNGALTQYTNFPFNHIVRFAGETVAFSDTGAAILGGALDEAAQIDAMAELSPADFETSLLKRMPYMYIGAKTSEKIRVSVVADENEIVASLSATNGRNRRAKMARGVKARFWAAKIENVGGSELSVDSVEYLPMVLRRKV